MTKNTKLLATYAFLFTMTVISATFAESGNLSSLLIILLCLSVTIKGRLVIDEFMGLRHASAVIRYSMHLYLIVIPGLFSLTLLFPDSLARMTSLH